MEVVERKGSRGGLLNLFDWPGKSRNKLFSPTTSKLSEEPNAQNLSNSRLSPVSHRLCVGLPHDSSDDRTRSPSVVARLMGLESLPLPNLQEPQCNDPNANQYENLGDGISWDHLDSRTKPIQRFQSETFPPKPICVTNNRLLSPIYVMEAASGMIEPSVTSVSNQKGSKVYNTVVNKVPVESILISKQSGLTMASAEKNSSLPLSRRETFPRGEKLSNGPQESG